MSVRVTGEGMTNTLRCHDRGRARGLAIAELGIVFFLSTGFCRAGAEEPVRFADAALKAAVENTLWIVDPTPADMLGLSSLFCSGWAGQGGVISDLAGLEYAVNLRSLSLQFHEFSSLSPLSGMINLERLDLRACPVCDISSLAGMPRLSWLSLHRTQIRDISPLLGLSSLCYIDLRGAPLNLGAYEVHIPHLRANRPEVTILYDPYRPPQYSGGSGTADDPYQIATADDLITLGETPADYDKHFVLTADIDLNPTLAGRKVFDRAAIAPDINPTTLLYEGSPFTGVLDGRGHTLRNLIIAGSQYLGLFGWIGPGGEVRNLELEAFLINGTGCFVGALVGRNRCGTIAASSSSGVVAGESNIGGLLGCNESGAVHMCHSHSSIHGTGWGVGGLVGINYGRVTTSYSTGPVGGTGSGAGGLVGDNEGDIATSYSSGSVGGQCDYVGGLVGENQGSISMSYSSGGVNGASGVGGLVGTAGFGSVVNQSFWDIEISGQIASDGGTGLMTVDMQRADVFLDAGWDFLGETLNGEEEIWWILDAKDYPRLWWELIAEHEDPAMASGTFWSGLADDVRVYNRAVKP